MTLAEFVGIAVSVFSPVVLVWALLILLVFFIATLLAGLMILTLGMA